MAVWLAYERRSWIDRRNRKEVESTDQQLARIDRWAADHALTVEHYTEPDGRRSGASIRHRPAYQRLLARIQSARPGEIAGVVLTTLDRASRDEQHLFELFNAVAERGLALKILDSPHLDIETSDGRFMAGIQVILAAQERRKVGERMRRNCAFRQSLGLYVGRDVYGYDRGTATNAQGHTQAVLVPNPVESERLIAILRKYTEEQIGIPSLAAWANVCGWTTKQGRAWSGEAVDCLLQNVMLYRGFVQIRNGARRRTPELVPGRHPAIIPEDLALAVLRRREQRHADSGGRGLGGRPSSAPYPLAGRIWCGKCGSRMVGQTRDKATAPTRPVYRCRKDRAPCDQTRVAAAHVEQQVWDMIGRLRRRIEEQAATDGLLADFQEAPAPLPSSPASGEIRMEMERLNRMFQKGRIDEDRYDREWAALAHRLDLADRAGTAAPDPADPLGLSRARDLCLLLDLAVLDSDRPGQQRAAHALIERVVVLNGDVVECRLTPELERLRELADSLPYKHLS